MMQKILLHACCAPCLIFPVQRLENAGFLVKGFFYNPNIHPFEEYRRRESAACDYAKSVAFDLALSEYEPEEFFRSVNGRESYPHRCSLCWTLRLKKTAQAARVAGFELFSTTLLVSPYQDQDVIRKIGDECAMQEGVGFYYEDFRPGFKAAHAQAHTQGIYCQKYCGCIYSEVDRCRKSQKR